MTDAMSGLRQFDRVQAVLPVLLDGGGNAVTRDLSPGGVFLVMDRKTEPGSVLHFTIEFDNPSGKLCVVCIGEVVRVETVEGKIGVAARIAESRMERRSTTRLQGVNQ